MSEIIWVKLIIIFFHYYQNARVFHNRLPNLYYMGFVNVGDVMQIEIVYLP